MHDIRFPSIEWLQVLRDRMNSKSEKYEHYGIADTTFVIQIDGDVTHRYVVELQDYECARVDVVTDPAEVDADFVISGPVDAWQEMAFNIARHGRADLEHSINRLTLLGTPLRTYSDTDQTRLERFSQYNYTIQSFLDEGGDISFEGADTDALLMGAIDD